MRIPALGVDSDLVGLGLMQDATLAAPSTAEQVGWYSGGVHPGDPGPAIVAGRVDLDGRAGVFQRLGTLAPGDVVEVIRADGSVVRFGVEAVDRYAKATFPTQEVYGPEALPVLRLVTCGGVFDAATGHYQDNVVVTARHLEG